MCNNKVISHNNNLVKDMDTNNNLQMCVKGNLDPVRFSARSNVVIASMETSHVTSSTRFSSRKLKVTNGANATSDNNDTNESNEPFVNATIDKIETVTHDVKCSVTAWKIGEDIWLLKNKVTTGVYDQIRILRAELHNHNEPQVGSTQTGGEIRIKKDITVWYEVWIYYLGAKENDFHELYFQSKKKQNNVWKENSPGAEKPTSGIYSSADFKAPSG